MTATVGFLLGRHPSGASVLAEVFGILRRAGVGISAWVCRADEAVPEELRSASVVALRQPGRDGIAVARRLEEAGARCCNTAAATAAASDKGAVLGALTGAGVPVPTSVILPTWAEARRAGAVGPVVVKALDGTGGTGVLLAERHGLPERAPFPGPYLVQERLAHPGPDRKVFVIGGAVWGVLRPWPPSGLSDKLGRSFDPTPEEEAVATRAGSALGLDVYGVDLVPTGDGPVVVDVNAFPGFKGVDGAAAALAAHLVALVPAEAAS